MRNQFRVCKRDTYNNVVRNRYEYNYKKKVKADND